ncbi:hypothetical protein N7462_008683 [Penicillium macrosclerotiorum]|uniref:uncharacterized protein n=1 Tax=Penicillium macrosclerotiorum TaxID=303699 RepID=UPI002549227A|nr:uncharacterized protein N7462_008683 [Penicillium macrosclerotiorum]KAJ5675786.1 hypothetical protein N7462_008683 [Penicillium macrosclerotiorum]
MPPQKRSTETFSSEKRVEVMTASSDLLSEIKAPTPYRIVSDSKLRVKTGSRAQPTKVAKCSKRWRRQGRAIITRYDKVPEDWISDDNDLDKDDVDANIQRCKERIEDGIMPHWWEDKLKFYQKHKDQKDAAIASEPAGLSWEAVMRLKGLDIIKAHILTKGDEWGQLSNVAAIMRAYRSGKLTWRYGYVTYWANGTLLGKGPVKFNWDDIDKWNALSLQHRVWVEGVSSSSGVLLKC